MRSIGGIGVLMLALGVAGDAAAYTDAPLCALRPEVPTTTPPPGPACGAMALAEAPVARVAPPEIPWTAPITPAEARAALAQAEALLAAGRADDAVLQLRLVEHAMPRVRDRVALMRAEALRQLGMPREACDAYGIAASSIDRNVAARGRVGGVHCLLEAGDRKGEEALNALLRRYPHLDERELLNFKLARAREQWGSTWGAVALYRNIDLTEPASPIAVRARAELERLRESGVAVPRYSPRERVERAERLLRSALLDDVVTEIEALQNEPRLDAELRGRVHVLAARVARIQGRWDAVGDSIQRARNLGAAVPDAGRILKGATTESPEAELAKRQARAITRGRPLRKLGNAQLRALIEVSARNAAADLADETARAMAVRTTLAPGARFEAAIRVAGLASDEAVAELLEPVIRVPKYQLAARYHYARALERAGRLGEAEAHYFWVRDHDRTDTRYYAMWADQRLWSVQSAESGACVPEGAAQASPSTAAADPSVPEEGSGLALIAKLITADEPVVDGHLRRHYGEAVLPPDGWGLRTGDGDAVTRPAAEDGAPNARLSALRDRLWPIAETHGEAYPWLWRAMDLIDLGMLEEAADELSETYLAWRDARGSPRLRSGIEAVFTGHAPARRPADWKLKQARLQLDEDARTELAAIASGVGEAGVAVHFDGFSSDERPRAYAQAVEQAARKYGIDPNLLFAVMRVESIYHRRIVSYAGAVGLMQIMPHTGSRIAQKLGVRDFEVTDLLDPKTNVEFSAWYLSSLIARFDGRLPLAIASYNGGPHNVRLWMQDNPPNMPLDAFLERIPFTQTHRYVRRVLTHYAAYRAQQHLPMTRLDVVLPKPKPDELAF